MVYKIILTTQAKTHFRQILDYLIYNLENRQAAKNVVDDFDETLLRLSHTASSLKLCDDTILQSKGYRIIHFRRHKYLMVYRICFDKVFVEGIYHDLQDYENILQ